MLQKMTMPAQQRKQSQRKRGDDIGAMKETMPA
jgi:hypothetical protein